MENSQQSQHLLCCKTYQLSQFQQQAEDNCLMKKTIQSKEKQSQEQIASQQCQLTKLTEQSTQALNGELQEITTEMENKINEQDQKQGNIKSNRIWKNRNILDIIINFLKNRDICNLQKINKYFYQFKFSYEALSIKKYKQRDVKYIQNKINWVLRQMTRQQVKQVKIDGSKLSNNICSQLQKKLNDLFILKGQNSQYINQNMIEKLYLWKWPIKNVDSPDFSLCKNLKTLNLLSVDLEDQNLAFLENVANLESIQIFSSDNITGQFLLDYCLNIKLKQLGIQSNKLNSNILTQYLQLKGNWIENININ